MENLADFFMNPIIYYLSLGSNLGNREKALKNALKKFQEFHVSVKKISSIYETEPVGFTDQPYFLNLAVKVETDLSPSHLLTVAKRIEFSLGRRSVIPNGPRLIDIDILLAGGTIINSLDLAIPHPRLHLRKFVLIPLAEIASRIRHPVFEMSVSRLLKMCRDESKIVLWGSE